LTKAPASTVKSTSADGGADILVVRARSGNWTSGPNSIALPRPTRLMPIPSSGVRKGSCSPSRRLKPVNSGPTS
jgi:hypothetical protein